MNLHKNQIPNGIWKLVIHGLGHMCHQVCSTDDARLSFGPFTERSNLLFLMLFLMSPGSIMFCLCPFVRLFLRANILGLGVHLYTVAAFKKRWCTQLIPEFSSNQFETLHRGYKHVEDMCM